MTLPEECQQLRSVTTIGATPLSMPPPVVCLILLQMAATRKILLSIDRGRSTVVLNRCLLARERPLGIRLTAGHKSLGQNPIPQSSTTILSEVTFLEPKWTRAALDAFCKSGPPPGVASAILESQVTLKTLTESEVQASANLALPVSTPCATQPRMSRPLPRPTMEHHPKVDSGA